MPAPRPSRQRRLSYDEATGVMNVSDDEEWVDAPDEEIDSDEDVPEGSSGSNGGLSTPGSGASAVEGVEGSNGGGGGGGTLRRARKTSTYWHHPDRKRVSAVFAASSSGNPDDSG